MNRDPYFDNLKFLLITLVVTGHAIYPLTKTIAAMHLLGLIIYSFHMPLFAFISGNFAKDFIQDKRAFKHIKKYLFLYLVFESVCIALFYDSFKYLLIPTDHMWYLLSLVFWLLLLPFFSRSKYLVILAVGLSLFIGYTGTGIFLSLSRTIVLLPFFLAGYHINKSGFTLPLLNKYLSAGVMVAASILMYCLSHTIRLDILFSWAVPFSVDARFISLGFAVVMSCCFMSIVPHRQTWFTPLGSRTLAVFIIHWPIIKALEVAGLYKLITSPLASVSIVASAVLLSIVLSYKPSLTLAKDLVFHHSKHGG